MSPAAPRRVAKRPSPSPAVPPSLRLERQLLRSGHTLVAGMDEVGRGATFFKRDVSSQAMLVQELLKGEFWPAMVGELPKLTRPGEAQAAQQARKKGGRGGHKQGRRRGR